MDMEMTHNTSILPPIKPRLLFEMPERALAGSRLVEHYA